MSEPTTSLDPGAVLQRAAEALRMELREIVGDAVDEASRELEELAEYLTVHWRLIGEGREAEAAENLEIIRATANLIAARYAIRATTAARKTVLQVVEELARIGAVLLRGLLK